VADIQLLMCGVATIDLDDWRGATNYLGGFNATSQTVQWFWSVVSQMDPAQQASLMFFSTGSSRVPAGGFAELVGYNGQQQQRFTLQAMPGTAGSNLPTAATCFNTLRLCFNTLRLPANYGAILRRFPQSLVGFMFGFHWVMKELPLNPVQSFRGSQQARQR
jgi:hypothetical protein